MKSKFLYLVFFIALGSIALQIPINKLAGSQVSFTLFDLFAPISGAFLGTIPGVVAVLIMEAVNLLIHGVSAIDRGAIIRLFPTLFGVWYFARAKSKNSFGELLLLAVPAVSIFSFVSNPVGRSVWFYSLFWTIPYLMWPLRRKSLLARSLGSTFTAHAAGGAVWIWLFHIPGAVWVSLIPVVIAERTIFTFGIAACFILTSNFLSVLMRKKLFPGIALEGKYLFRFAK